MAISPERQAELNAMADEHTNAVIAVGACTDPRRPKDDEEKAYFSGKMDILMQEKCSLPPPPQG